MSPNNVRSRQHRSNGSRQAALDSMARFRIQDFADKRLARSPHEHWLTQSSKHRKPAQQLQVVLQGLAETNSRIDDDHVLGNAGIHGCVKLRGEKIAYFPDDV